MPGHLNREMVPGFQSAADVKQESGSGRMSHLDTEFTVKAADKVELGMCGKY